MPIIIVKDVNAIPEDQIKSVLLQLGILKDESKDPIKDMAHAWELLQSRIWGKWGSGFLLEVRVTDAINGYGHAEHWDMSLIEYEEWCSICGRDNEPKVDENYKIEYPHLGNHKWRHEWAKKYHATAFTPQVAICKSLILEAMAAANTACNGRLVRPAKKADPQLDKASAKVAGSPSRR